MHHRRVVMALLGLTFLLCGTAACGTGSGSSGDKLVFAAIPSEQDTDARQSYKTVIDMLEQTTGKRVEFRQSTNYNGVIEGLKSGTVDVAVLGPFSYVLAQTVGAKITPVAISVEDDKKPTYNSYGIARGNESDVRSISDFKGKKVCFVDPASTSGYLFPTAALEQNHIDPDKDITKVFAGAHDLSALSVKSGKCDVGFADNSMVDKTLPASGKLKKGDLKVVWRSVPIPSSPVAMRSALPDDVKKKIVSTFITKLNKDWLVKNGKCTSRASCHVAGDPTTWGYLPASDKAYDSVRKVCRITHDKQCRSTS